MLMHRHNLCLLQLLLCTCINFISCVLLLKQHAHTPVVFDCLWLSLYATYEDVCRHYSEQNKQTNKQTEIYPKRCKNLLLINECNKNGALFSKNVVLIFNIFFSFNA